MGRRFDESLVGTRKNDFQVGPAGGGQRSLGFFNGFLGRLLWTPTAARNITLPDQSGTVPLISNVTNRIEGLLSSNGNGQPVVHEQLGSGFNPNVVLSNWTPGAAVNNSIAEIPVGSYQIGGAGFQIGSHWVVAGNWVINYPTGANMAANFRVFVDGTLAASNENTTISIPSSANTKRCFCHFRLVAVSATQLSIQAFILRLGVGITIDSIDQGNTWDHTGVALVTVPDLNTARTLLLTFQPETASPDFLVTPYHGSLQEIRPNGSIPSATPGGANRELQYNNNGSFAGATNVEIDTGNLSLAIVADPIAAATGFVTNTPRGGAEYANIPSLLLTPALGSAQSISPFIGLGCNISNWFPPPGTQPLQTVGGAFLFNGTATAAAIATTNIHTRTFRVDYLVTTAAATAVAGVRDSAVSFSIGGASAGQGGFMLRMIGAPATGLATLTSRFFMGITGTAAAPTDVEPSSITNILGIGYDSADTNLQLMHRGTGAVTKIDLGANFPVPTVDRSTMYLLLLNALPGTTQTVYYSVWNLGTGLPPATGVITTNLPAASNLLIRRIWSSVGGTSSVTGVAVGSSELRANIA